MHIPTLDAAPAAVRLWPALRIGMAGHMRRRWTTAAISTIIAPNWWVSATSSGTTRSSVVMPRIACSVTNSARPMAKRPIGRAAGLPGMGPGEREQQIGAEAVVELHRHHALEEIAPPGRMGEQAGGHQSAVHQRPGVVSEPGMQARHQPAKEDLQAGEADQKPGDAAQAVARAVERTRRQAARQPHRIGEQHRGECQMGGEPVLADAGAHAEAARHHPPADQALQPAEQEERHDARLHAGFDAARHPEEDQRQQHHHADQPAEQPVAPLPPEDALELGERHALVELLVLRDLLVLGEFLLPLRLGERRNDAVDRLPCGDRQAGLGEPCRAAHHHHGHDHQGDHDQPCPHHRAVAAVVPNRRCLISGDTCQERCSSGIGLQESRGRGQAFFRCGL